VNVVHRTTSRANEPGSSAQTFYVSVVSLHPRCRWSSLDKGGPYSEVKHSASMQSSSLAEREAVVVQRIPRLYLYLRRQVGMGMRTSSSTRCKDSLKEVLKVGLLM
jgi:hypothetical protein